MTREEKIEMLLKIAKGEASPEALRPKQMVLYITRNENKRRGLYVNDKPSTDPKDMEAFGRAFAEGEVNVTRNT